MKHGHSGSYQPTAMPAFQQHPSPPAVVKPETATAWRGRLVFCLRHGRKIVAKWPEIFL